MTSPQANDATHAATTPPLKFQINDPVLGSKPAPYAAGQMEAV
jgi:hypothetical protein